MLVTPFLPSFIAFIEMLVLNVERIRLNFSAVNVQLIFFASADDALSRIRAAILAP